MSHLYAEKEEKKLLNRMEKYRHNHLLFLYNFAVPFDDNMSERDLRKAKNCQKMSGGFRKGSGRSIQTVIETLKRRKMGDYRKYTGYILAVTKVVMFNPKAELLPLKIKEVKTG